MPHFIFPLSFLLFFSLPHPGIDLSVLSYQGLSFSNTQANIIQELGEAQIHHPQYKCGFHSDEEQSGGPYSQLIYPEITFIGSEKEGYIFEHIRFDSLGKVSLQYKTHSLTGQTTVEAFGRIFPEDEQVQKFVAEYPENNGVTINSYAPEFQQFADDGAYFQFERGLLVEYRYVSPC